MEYKLPKPLGRVFDLLNLLIDSKKPLSKHEVALIIGCTRPTLDKTIVDANNLITDFSHIEFTNEGLFLTTDSYLNKRQVKSLVSSETFIVQFLSDILLGKIEHIEDWAQTRFYSSSVAYRNLRDVNEYLGTMGVQLVNEKNFWFLKGDSWKIRYLYYEMLKELAIVDDVWLFDDLEYNVLLRFVRMIGEELELYISPIVEYFYTLMTAVHLSMAVNPYAVESIDDEKFRYFLESHMFTEPLAILERHVSRKFSNNEKAMLISSIELFPVRYLTEEAMHRRVAHSSYTDHDVYQLAMDAYQFFHPGDRNIKKLVSYLDIFTPLQLLGNYETLDFVSSKEILQFKEPNTINFDFLRKIMLFEKELKEKEYGRYYFENQVKLKKKLYGLYMNYSNQVKNRLLRLTFLSQDGYSQEKNYYQQVKSYFADDRLDYMQAQEVHDNNLWQEIDIIVTDYTIASFHYSGNIFYVDGLITESELKQLEKLVIKLEKKLDEV